ncbi:MAG: hypothetical protein ACRDBL_02305 [Rhabdaerophilum sp.]
MQTDDFPVLTEKADDFWGFGKKTLSQREPENEKSGLFAGPNSGQFSVIETTFSKRDRHKNLRAARVSALNAPNASSTPARMFGQRTGPLIGLNELLEKRSTANACEGLTNHAKRDCVTPHRRPQ